MTERQKDTYDRVILTVVAIVGMFILISMIGQFLLVWTGRFPPDQTGVFKPIFDLVIVLVGAVGGYIAGERIERGRNRGDDT